ncbi:hypothetical protein JXB01_04575 [Candidatus Micrarchaeota archaeon]|nr:hypothetical protein [Candidatus Micrarchaeota archaeon]
MEGSTKKAFVFSLDAYIAFTLLLLAVYSLIYFSSIPNGYYSSLMQANRLSTDTLYTLSVTPIEEEGYGQITVLSYLAHRGGDVPSYMGEMIPNQFGYRLEIGDGDNWAEIYDTADHPNDPHRKVYTKLKAVSYAVVTGYEGSLPDRENPYGYNTCNGDGTLCDMFDVGYDPGGFTLGIVRLIVYV